MPSFICESCGSVTNIACSNAHEHRCTKVTKCYAKYIHRNKWVKGCAFDEASDFNKAYAMSLITGKNILQFYKRKK